MICAAIKSAEVIEDINLETQKNIQAVFNSRFMWDNKYRKVKTCFNNLKKCGIKG